MSTTTKRDLTIIAREPLADLNRRSAEIQAKGVQAPLAQPSAALTGAAADVIDPALLGKPARLDCFDQLVLRLFGPPKWIIIWASPFSFPSRLVTNVRPAWEAVVDQVSE
jgi:hypothetical protein